MSPRLTANIQPPCPKCGSGWVKIVWSYVKDVEPATIACERGHVYRLKMHVRTLDGDQVVLGRHLTTKRR